MEYLDRTLEKDIMGATDLFPVLRNRLVLLNAEESSSSTKKNFFVFTDGYINDTLSVQVCFPMTPSQNRSEDRSYRCQENGGERREEERR